MDSHGLLSVLMLDMFQKHYHQSSGNCIDEAVNKPWRLIYELSVMNTCIILAFYTSLDADLRPVASIPGMNVTFKFAVHLQMTNVSSVRLGRAGFAAGGAYS